MEEADELEEFLSLRLSVVADSRYDRKMIMKRKRKELAINYPLSIRSNIDDQEDCEGKIFSLLQMREQMLRLDHHPKCKKMALEEEGSKGLRLLHQLLVSATSIDENKLDSAIQSLQDLYTNISLDGDSVQRVAAYFADGLVARLLTKKSPFYDMIIKEPSHEEEFLAFTELYKVSPYYQFAHFTANQAIIEAFEKEEDRNNRSLHVVDFDVSYGFQWPSLIQSLSEKGINNGNHICLRITGFGRSLEELQETETRLVSFAKGFQNISFEFKGMLRGSDHQLLVNLKKKKNETIAANLVFHLNTLSSSSKISDTLKSVHLLNPSIVILVEQEGSRSPRLSFLSRFMECLHYFAAMFDSLEDCLPLDSPERLKIEKNHLGKEIKRFMNYDSDEVLQYCPKYERMETWKGRMENHGFSGLKLSSKSVIQAKLLLKIRSHYCSIQSDGDSGGFRVLERDDGTSISLGWQDRCLVTASTWHCL